MSSIFHLDIEALRLNWLYKELAGVIIDQNYSGFEIICHQVCSTPQFLWYLVSKSSTFYIVYTMSEVEHN